MAASAISFRIIFTIACGGRMKPAIPVREGAYVPKARGISSSSNLISAGLPCECGGMCWFGATKKLTNSNGDLKNLHFLGMGGWRLSIWSSQTRMGIWKVPISEMVM